VGEIAEEVGGGDATLHEGVAAGDEPAVGAQPVMLEHRCNWKKATMAAALCYGVRGGGASLAFHLQPGNYNTESLLQVLAELRRFLGGEKATLLWDGLPAHRSSAMQAWLSTQRQWLVVERLPAYARPSSTR
jgi:hypothetical protein